MDVLTSTSHTGEEHKAKALATSLDLVPVKNTRQLKAIAVSDRLMYCQCQKTHPILTTSNEEVVDSSPGSAQGKSNDEKFRSAPDQGL